jgi:hypothetical protein
VPPGYSLRNPTAQSLSLDFSLRRGRQKLILNFAGKSTRFIRRPEEQNAGIGHFSAKDRIRLV